LTRPFSSSLHTSSLQHRHCGTKQEEKEEQEEGWTDSVSPVTPPPPLLAHSLGFFPPRFPGVCAVGGFHIVNHYFPVVLSESTCRKWGESTKGKASGSKLGRAGDGARELLPWTACPGTQKNLDPEHPLARDSRGRRLAPFYISRLIQLVLCPRTTYHAPTLPAVPSCARERARARAEMLYGLRR
jgi:hypothetical protein